MKQNYKSRGAMRRSYYNTRHANNGNCIPTRNTTFDSAGPCGRIRGNSSQLIEKYQNAAKDLRYNDPIMSEVCSQYADHYQRLYNLATGTEQGLNSASNTTASPTPLQQTVAIDPNEIAVSLDDDDDDDDLPEPTARKR